MYMCQAISVFSGHCGLFLASSGYKIKDWSSIYYCLMDTLITECVFSDSVCSDVLWAHHVISLSVSILLFSLGGKKKSNDGSLHHYPSSWVIPVVVLSFKTKQTQLQLQYKQPTCKVWWLFAASSPQGSPAHTFLCPGTAAAQIKLWEVSACVCAYVRRGVVWCCVYSQLLPVQVLQASLTQCVRHWNTLRSSQQLQTGLISAVCLKVSVH